MKSQRDAKFFQERTGSQWTDSKTITSCTVCLDKFTVLNRKHHCRQCGQVVCRKCSPERSVIGNAKVRVCISCTDRTRTDSSGNSDICLICRNVTNSLSEPLIKSMINPNVPAAWHKSCAKCMSCGVGKNLGELHISPPVGSILYTLPDIQVHCYCDAHIGDMNSMVSGSKKHDMHIVNSLDSDNKVTLTPSQKIAYGPSESQYFKLYIPVEAVQDTDLHTDLSRNTSLASTSSLVKRSVPIAVLIHGGFWKAKYGIENAAIDNLVPSLLSSGMAVCLIEYRRIGSTNPNDEGGWPSTNDDIMQALRRLHEVVSNLHAISIDRTVLSPLPPVNGRDVARVQLKQKARVDMNRLVLIGHSAGGYLALWSCCRLATHALPFKPLLCVAIAPVCDLAEACRRKLSDDGDAVEKYMKVPFEETPECHLLYDEACPSKQLPVEVPTIIAIGTSDTDIPLDMVEDFYWYAKKVGGEVATRGAPVTMAFSADSGDVMISSLAHHEEISTQLHDESEADRASSSNMETRNSEAASAILSAETKSGRQSLSSCAVPVPIKLVKLQDADHYDVVNAKTSAWGRIFDEMNNIAPSLSDIPLLENIDENLDRLVVMLDDCTRDNDKQGIESLRSGSVAPASSNSGGMGSEPPSSPIRCVPSRWASDISDELDKSKDIPYDSGLSSESDDDGNQDEIVEMKSDASASRNNRISRNSRDDSDVGMERQSENPDAEIFFFPTPKSDRPRRNHSFSFRFGR